MPPPTLLSCIGWVEPTALLMSPHPNVLEVSSFGIVGGLESVTSTLYRPSKNLMMSYHSPSLSGRDEGVDPRY